MKVLAKTEFQAALAAFVRLVADDAAMTLGPNSAAVIGSVVEALIDLRNAKMLRMKGMSPTCLVHLHQDVERNRAEVVEVLARW